MGNIAVGSGYLSILRDICISKVQRKAADTVDDNHEPGAIDGCAVSGQV